MAERARTIYVGGEPARWFEEPWLWLLQTLILRVLTICERTYSEAPDSDPAKRRWLALWRTFKATVDASLTKDDTGLEYLGAAASEVLRHIENKHAQGESPFAVQEGCPSLISLNGIGLDFGYQFGDVPFGISLLRTREEAAQCLLNTLRHGVLRRANEWTPEKSGQDQFDHMFGWHENQTRCSMAWEPTMTPEKFANMAPHWASIVHQVTVASPSKRPTKQDKPFKPGSPLKTLVPDDRARPFARKQLPSEIRTKLEKEFRRFQRDTKPRDLRADDEPLKKLARAMLKALGAPASATNDVFRIEETASKVADCRAKTG